MLHPHPWEPPPCSSHLFCRAGMEVARPHSARGEIRPIRGCGCHSVQKPDAPPVYSTYSLYGHLPNSCCFQDKLLCPRGKKMTMICWGVTKQARDRVRSEPRTLGRKPLHSRFPPTRGFNTTRSTHSHFSSCLLSPSGRPRGGETRASTKTLLPGPS